MKLRRQRSKRDQALDAVASVAKTWSEWRLGEKVSKTASKASRKAAKKASKASLPQGAKRNPVKIAGMLALVGGIGAAVAKKLTGGKAEPLYTPPEPAAEPASAPFAGDDPATVAPAETATVPSIEEPALTDSADLPGLDSSPAAGGDLLGNEPAVNEPVAPEEPEAVTPAQDPAPSGEAPDADDLTSDTADRADDAGDESPDKAG
ncbi:MAG: hypothetical protein M3N04_01545 [Actinomycetota bacterium]|nr:hypothetical protein [Actinomycetota bacterium]